MATYRRRRKAKGLWDSVKKGLTKLKDWTKENNAISRSLRMFGSKTPLLGALADFAEKKGYGRKKRAGRKRVVRRRRARGLWDSVKKGFSKIKDWAKENHAVSKTLRMFGGKIPIIGGLSEGLADLAYKHGYGRRMRKAGARRVRRVRR